MRGIFCDGQKMLNKITGCESRTVPPLYVLWRILWRKPVTGDTREGRICCEVSQGMSQKTYALVAPVSACLRKREMSQKNGCGADQWHRSLFAFQEE